MGAGANQKPPPPIPSTAPIPPAGIAPPTTAPPLPSSSNTNVGSSVHGGVSGGYPPQYPVQPPLPPTAMYASAGRNSFHFFSSSMLGTKKKISVTPRTFDPK